jgi:hypothetical protein
MPTPFPYIFIRYAALPGNCFQPLQLHGTNRFIQIQEHIIQKLTELRNALCDDLYKIIPQQTNDETRNLLIQLKRNIYNNKPITITETKTADFLPASVAGRLQQYILWQYKLTSQSKNWEHYFNIKLYRHRKYLQQLAGNELLQKGLLLSSMSLYEQLPAFILKEPADFRHKEYKNEHSLLRYLTRMTFKTSPFSAFTSTGAARLHEQTDNLHIAIDLQTKSNTRCNNLLLAYIHDLLLQHPVLNDLLLIRLNSTAVVNNNSVQFLVNYYNIESFQHVYTNAIIQWIVDFFQQQQEVSLATLTNEVTSQVSDADRQQVKLFLIKLVTAGLLEAGSPVSGIHPNWDEQLYAFLEPNGTAYPSVQPLCNLLCNLANVRRTYNEAPARDRYQLLQQTAGLLNNTLGLLQKEAGITTYSEQTAREQQQAAIQQWKENSFGKLPFIPQQFSPAAIFYEDCSTPGTAHLPEQTIQRFVTKTEALCSLLTRLDPLQQERVRMCAFFLKHYSPEAVVPVMDFYRTYYLQEKKQLLAEAAGRQPQKSSLQEIWKQLLQAMHITISDAQRYCVFIKATGDAIDHNTTSPAGAMFMQFFTENNECKGVINHVLPGLGKVAGRFLYLFDEAVTQAFNDWNNNMHPDILLMELSDGSGFNANIHPPLLPFELHLPGGHNNFPLNRQVQLKDLNVQYDSNSKSLYLRHTSLQKKVFAYDLSLESFSRRSHLYQLLAHFNTEHRILLRQFNKLVDDWVASQKSSAEGGVISKPRIVFDQDIILRRAGWVVKTQVIPAQDTGEQEAAWFVKLNAWRQQQRIPEHVFVYLHSPYLPEGEHKKKSRDDHKPQYIHFNTPLLAALFKKLISRSTQIYIEEMLPHISQLQHHSGEPRVTEQLIHWYNN